MPCHFLSWPELFPRNHIMVSHCTFFLSFFLFSIFLLSLISFFIIIYLFIFYFTVLYWFCHTTTCICHRCTRVPHLEPPSNSLSIPSLWIIPVHQPQASCILHRTWTGDSFLMWYYTCFNAILPNHLSSLSPRVQKTVLCICVSFAILHTGLSFLYRILFVSKLPSFHSHLTHEDHLESWSSEYYFLISSAQIFKILVPSYYPFSYCVLLVPWLSVSLVHLHFDASNITLRIILIVVVVQ